MSGADDAKEIGYPKSHRKDNNQTEFFDPITVKKALNRDKADALAKQGFAGLAGGRVKLIPTNNGCNCD